jgi:hypothetical protein
MDIGFAADGSRVRTDTEIIASALDNTCDHSQ